MRNEEMRRFWDERAAEDPFYFVDNELDYGNPDTDRFWARGREALDGVLGAAGVELTPQHRVVEVGCGIGRITRELASRVSHVDAVDVSEKMLELAQAHNPGLTNVCWVLGDGDSLNGIADVGTDVCFSHVVFQHLPDPAITHSYVREMGRVLTANGWAAFQVSNLPQLHERPSAATRLGGALRAALGQGPRGQAHPAWRGSAVDLDELRDTAHSADMKLERLVGAGTQFCTVLLRKSPASSA